MAVSADCAVSACSPLLHLEKLLSPDCQRGVVSLWLGDPPTLWLLASETKQTSLSTSLASVLASKLQAAGLPLSVARLWVPA